MTQDKASTSSATSGLWSTVIIFLISTVVFSAALYWLQLILGWEMQLVTIVQFGPTLGVLTTWLIRPATVRALLPTPAEPLTTFAVRLGITLVAVALFLGLTLAAAVAVGMQAMAPLYSGGMLIAFLVLQLLGALGEEIGWRGFFQPVVARRYGPWWAAVIVGVIWSAWHANRLAMPLLFVAFTITSIGISLALWFFGNGTWWQRGLIAGLLHWALNISIMLLTDLERSYEPAAMAPMAIPPLVLTAVAVVGMLLKHPVRDSSPDYTGLVLRRQHG